MLHNVGPIMTIKLQKTEAIYCSRATYVEAVVLMAIITVHF